MDGTQKSLQCCAVKIAVIITDILENFLEELTSQTKNLAAVGTKSSNQKMKQCRRPFKLRDDTPFPCPLSDQDDEMESESCPEDDLMLIAEEREVREEFIDLRRPKNCNSRRSRSVSPARMEERCRRPRHAMYEECNHNIIIPAQAAPQPGGLVCRAHLTCEPQMSSRSQEQICPNERFVQRRKRSQRPCHVCAPCLQLQESFDQGMEDFESPNRCRRPCVVQRDECHFEGVRQRRANPCIRRPNFQMESPPPGYNNPPRFSDPYPFPGLHPGQLLTPDFALPSLPTLPSFPTPPLFPPPPNIGSPAFQMFGFSPSPGPNPNRGIDNNFGPPTPIQNTPIGDHGSDETLNKTVEITVHGIENIMKHWEKAIDTSKLANPDNVDEKCKVLAAKLMNKNHRLEDLRSGIEDMLTQLQGVLLNSSPYGHWLIQECLNNIVRRRSGPKCPNCCTCGSPMDSNDVEIDI